MINDSLLLSFNTICVQVHLANVPIVSKAILIIFLIKGVIAYLK